MVEAQRYTSEGRRFDYFRPHYGPGIDSASNRNEYQEYFLGVKAAGAKEPQPPGTLRACPGFAMFVRCVDGGDV